LICQREDRLATARAKVALRRAIASLNAEDRTLLELRYTRGESTADISRRMKLDQKGLYRKFDRMLAGLRSELEGEGIRHYNLSLGC
jgi:DNA-directed RNA polymerase specialized sigma24 family protein